MWTKFLKRKVPSSYIMYYVLVYYPEFDEKTEENIEAFRRKYDPFVDSWQPHITFIFPIACSEVEEEKLTAHIETVLRNWKPFPIHIGGFTKSWDHWLFLLLKKGNEEAIALHDELYSGIGMSMQTLICECECALICLFPNRRALCATIVLAHYAQVLVPTYRGTPVIASDTGHEFPLTNISMVPF
jgi:hypothetical protein